MIPTRQSKLHELRWYQALQSSKLNHTCSLAHWWCLKHGYVIIDEVLLTAKLVLWEPFSVLSWHDNNGTIHEQ